MPKDDFDPEDPMEFVGVAIPGDAREAMIETFVVEFLWMGYDEERLLALFRNPGYAATHAAWKERGDDGVRKIVRRVIARWTGTPATPPAKEVHDA